MKISASIYSGNAANIESEIKELDLLLGVDYYHVDSIEVLEVFNEIKFIKSFSKKPVDLHIISQNPEKYYDQIDEYEVDFVAFQIENLPKDFSLPTFKNSKIGIAIQAETDLEVLKPFVEKIDFLLFMTTIPGKSGGTFKKENFDKIRFIKKKHPTLTLHVDGGVNNEVSFILRSMGVEVAISGSYLMKNASLGNALVALKHQFQGSEFTVREMMMNRDELPILKYNDADFYKILTTIEQYQMGFCFFEDENQQFMGLCSNADIRKALIKKYNTLKDIKAEDLINRKPISILENKNIHQMLDLVKQTPFLLTFIPVVSENNQLVGAISFNQLIKGES